MLGLNATWVISLFRGAKRLARLPVVLFTIFPTRYFSFHPSPICCFTVSYHCENGQCERSCAAAKMKKLTRSSFYFAASEWRLLVLSAVGELSWQLQSQRNELAGTEDAIRQLLSQSASNAALLHVNKRVIKFSFRTYSRWDKHMPRYVISMYLIFLLISPNFRSLSSRQIGAYWTLGINGMYWWERDDYTDVVTPNAHHQGNFEIWYWGR